MKILNYGSLNIDHVYQVPHIVRPGETLPGGDLKLFAGGKGANQSVALAKAGAEVYHAGKIGEDGRWLLDKLGSAGADTDLVRIYDGPTGHAIIQVARDGENAIVLFGGGNRNLEEQEILETFEHFGEGDYLVLQNEVNNIPFIMKTAYTRGMKICLNPAPFYDEVNSYPLELVSVLIVNETEAEGLAGRNGDPDEILNALVDRYPHARIVMTLGKNGSLYGHGEHRELVPIYPAPVVDTTAAGDTFLGFFLASLLEGHDIRTCLKTATRASAVTVSRAGAMESIPYMSELN